MDTSDRPDTGWLYNNSARETDLTLSVDIIWSFKIVHVKCVSGLVLERLREFVMSFFSRLYQCSLHPGVTCLMTYFTLNWHSVLWCRKYTRLYNYSLFTQTLGQWNIANIEVYTSKNASKIHIEQFNCNS